MDEQFSKQVNAVEQEGQRKFGQENWETMMVALRRATAANGGISEGEMRSILATGNAPNVLYNAGRHQLMAEASDGNAESEMTYSKIRNAERRAYREARGR